MALGSQENLLVLCHLEYWSECRNCYLPYTQFYLSESEICHLSLPEGQPRTIVASTWRVVITTTNERSDDLEECSYHVTLSPRALAACMRIDSYFNKSLIPNLNAALYITKVEVNLYNFFPKNNDTRLPECLKRYKSDLSYPENQRFIALLLENITSYTAVWSLDIISAEVGCSTQCSVLDYAFLTEHLFIPPFSSKLELSLSKSLRCNFISKPIQVKFGPTVAHTLAVSSQMWQNKNVTNSSDLDFIVVTRYVICNDLNAILRFGQNDTEENILLLPRQFHLYSWRSQKKGQTLRISIEQLDWKWSEPFRLNQDGIYPLEFKTDKDIVIYVRVKSLSKTQKQITLYGQLIVFNLLSEHLEMKLVEAVTEKESKEIEFRNADTHIVTAKSPAPSLLISNTKSYFLRLRFFGLDSAWTGDIPLREHLTGAQPWLVKVPLQERGQFLSVWCRIVVQNFSGTKRILAMVWPLFMVRSNLPMSTKVHIETPTLGVHLDSEITGKGVLQQLYCPGTIDHSHQLTFHLEEGNSNANVNPYVPLNYSLVDQQKFFKKSTKEDIDAILESLEDFDKVKWPYFGDDMDVIEWIIDNQPLTHVQVRYQNASQHSCALLVELLPWCLMVNTLGTTVAIMLNNVELCQIAHHGMVAPPRLEEAFHIGVFSGSNWFFSGPLQLAKSDWSQAFYMPKITGTIPLEGTTKTAIQSDSYICMVLVTSSISNEIKLLRLSSTHVLSNHMSMQVQVLCLAVANNKVVSKLPQDVDEFCFTVPPHLQKSHSGIPIMQWCTLKDVGEISSQEYALYILFCVELKDGWSCPIRVDKPLIRKAFSIRSKDLSVPVVLTAQDVKGQIFLAIEDDPCPQLFIDNKTSVPLRCGQALQDDSGVVNEVEHLIWNCKIDAFKSIYYNMPILAEKFPEIPQVNFSEKISFAYDCEDDTNIEWSAGVSIVNNNSLFIRIPHYGDVKISIVNTASTTIFVIESVSQVEISAKDIRVRLSLRESEKLPAFEVASKGLERFVKANLDPSRTTIDSQFNSTEPPSMHSLNFNSTQSVVPVLNSVLIPTLPLGGNLKSLEFNVFINSFTVTLSTDLENEGEERWELASLICDNILVKGVQNESLKVRLTVSDSQFDNQLYTRESYDFPVVLVGQDRKSNRTINILSIPVDTLLQHLDSEPLVCVDFIMETWHNRSSGKTSTGVKQIKLTLNPLSCFIEDVFITRLIDYLKTFSPINVVMWPCHKPNYNIGINSSSVNIPELVSWQCTLLAQPLTVRNFVVNPVSILLSVHSSVKMYIALDQSPLQFSKFERRRLFTTHYRLGHALTMHYLSGAIFGAGWVVSSLELLGSPGGLARAMGTGLRDFVSLPYRGLLQGPWAFLRGITTGSASLMRHFTAGTLQSVTKLASSVARNLDRLTLDEEHQKRAEEQRRQRPQGVTQGFLQGMTSLGISLLGAVGGIAHHPLQSVMSDGASPRSLATGLGLGLVGVLTKPLSGAAELVALTGQGLLQGAGWNSLPDPRTQPQVFKITLTNNSMLKYNWKFINLPHSQMLYVAEATLVHGGTIFAAVALILTTDSVVIVDLDEDEIKRVIPLQDVTIIHTSDPTLLSFKLTPPAREKVERSENELDIEMDPVQRARVVDYVRSTAGLLRFPELNSEHSDISISPLNSPDMSPIPSPDESTVLNFYVSAQKIAYFSCLLTLAKQHSVDDHFPIL